MSTNKKLIRIASGQGFWGDMLDAPVRQVEGGQIDYLMLDYLAEVTMSIMQKQRARDPAAGYARDFVPLMREMLPACVEQEHPRHGQRGRREPGGVRRRPSARWRANSDSAGRLRIGIVTGDDIMDRLDEFLARGHRATQHGHGRAALDRARCDPERERLPRRVADGRGVERGGAQIVITGRATDTGLTLAPLHPRVRLARRRLGQALGRDHRRAHHRVRRAVFGRQLSVRLGGDTRSGERRVSHRRSAGRRHVRRHQASKAPAAASRSSRSRSSSSTRWATRTRTSRPIASRTSRRSSSKTQGTNRVRVHGIKGDPATETSKSRSVMRRASRRSARSSTRGPTHIEKARSGGSQSCASGSNVSASRSTTS